MAPVAVSSSGEETSSSETAEQTSESDQVSDRYATPVSPSTAENNSDSNEEKVATSVTQSSSSEEEVSLNDIKARMIVSGMGEKDEDGQPIVYDEEGHRIAIGAGAPVSGYNDWGNKVYYDMRTGDDVEDVVSFQDRVDGKMSAGTREAYEMTLRSIDPEIQRIEENGGEAYDREGAKDLVDGVYGRPDKEITLSDGTTHKETLDDYLASANARRDQKIADMQQGAIDMNRVTEIRDQSFGKGAGNAGKIGIGEEGGEDAGSYNAGLDDQYKSVAETIENEKIDKIFETGDFSQDGVVADDQYTSVGEVRDGYDVTASPDESRVSVDTIRGDNSSPSTTTSGESSSSPSTITSGDGGFGGEGEEGGFSGGGGGFGGGGASGGF